MGDRRRVAAVVAGEAVNRLRRFASQSEVDMALLIRPDSRRPAPAVASFANEVLTGGVDGVVVHSATELRGLLAEVFRTVDRRRFLDGLSDIDVISATEEGVAALAEWGIASRLGSRSGDWRELLVFLEHNRVLAHQCLVVERFPDHPALAAGLESRGAQVVEFPAMPIPEKLGSADREAIREWIDTAVQADCWLFETPTDAAWLWQDATAERLGEASAGRSVGVGSPETQSWLRDHGVHGNFWLWPAPGGGGWLAKMDGAGAGSPQEVRISETSGGGMSEDTARPAWEDSPFLKACRGEPTEVTPVWLMRQAGRYMKEYREVRAKVSFLELCANPQLCSEVMCTAVARLGVDAAIIFSDLLPILVPMGADLEFVRGDGPVIHNPVRTLADIDRIRPLENLAELEFVMETVRQTRRDLPEQLPLIGFAGAPFTLASYLIEGGASRNYARTKQLMRSDPTGWNELMERLSRSITLYLQGQAEAGAQCLQLFDSWAGCLGELDYRRFVLPHVQRIISALPTDVPVINFATGNPALLPQLADTEAAVIGIDWRIRLDDAWETVGWERAVQGNLDPTVLLSGLDAIRTGVEETLGQADGRPGHIFNLGHGILPETPVEHAVALVEMVHETSSRRRSRGS